MGRENNEWNAGYNLASCKAAFSWVGSEDGGGAENERLGRLCVGRG